MSELLRLLLALAGGIALGAVFFGGLWWTVRASLTSRRAGLWFAGSFVLRTSVVVAGFCLIGRGRWELILASLLGFTATRWTVTRLPGSSGASQALAVREAGHAPQP
jgi:F1F0 ATPase subunit 2